MFTLKNKYFLIIESIKDLNLKNIKKRNKFNIIYRNKKNHENIADLLIFRRGCKLKSIKFYEKRRAPFKTSFSMSVLIYILSIPTFFRLKII